MSKGHYDKEEDKWYIFDTCSREEIIELDLEVDLILHYQIVNECLKKCISRYTY